MLAIHARPLSARVSSVPYKPIQQYGFEIAAAIEYRHDQYPGLLDSVDDPPRAFDELSIVAYIDCAQFRDNPAAGRLCFQGLGPALQC